MRLTGLLCALLLGCSAEVDETNPFDPSAPASVQQGAALRGQLVLPKGFRATVFSEAEVIATRLEDTQPNSTTVDDEGAFAFVDLVPGTYRLEAVVGGLTSERVTLTLGIGAELDYGLLQLSLPEGEVVPPAQVEGRAELTGQEGHGGITIQVQGTSFSGITRPGGGYTLELPHRAEAYTLDFAYPGYATAQVDVLADEAGRRFEAPLVSLGAQPGTLSGEVSVDRLVLAELAGGIQIQISREGEETTFNETVSAEGAFAREVAAGRWRVRATLEGFAPAETVVEVSPGGAAHTGVLTLKAQEATLFGRVRLRGAEGTPVRVRSTTTGVETETNAEGAFELKLTARTHTIRVIVPAGYRLPEEIRESEIAFAPGERVPFGEDIWAETTRTATVSGVLRSSLEIEDWPLRSVVTLSGEGVERIATVVTAEGAGAFEVADLEPGRYRLSVQVRGHLRHEALHEVPAEGLELPPIELEAERLRFEGLVEATGGGPIADVIVRARRGERPADSGITDAAGRFSLDLNAEAHTLSLSHSDYLPVAEANLVMVGEALAPEAPLRMDPLPRATLLGRLDSPLDLEDWNGRAVVTLTRPGLDRLAVPQPDGAFRFEDVAPGPYELAVSARGHAPQARPVELVQGEQDLGVIVLAPDFVDEDAITLTGQVRLDDVAEDGDHSGVVVRGRIGANPVFTTTTDPEGAFVAFVSGDDHELSFSKPGYTRISEGLDWVVEVEHFLWGDPPEVVGENHVFATLLSQNTARLAGTLRSPLGVADWNDRALLVLADASTQRSALVVTNEDGSAGFEFSALRPGTYTLSVQVRGHEPLLRRVEVDAETPALDLELVPNPELYSARIVDPDDAPIEGVIVRARIGQNVIDTGISDANGSFTLSLVPESHALSFTHPAYESPAPIAIDWVEAGFARREGEEPYTLQPVAGRITVTVNVLPDWLPEHQRVVRVQVIGEGEARTEERVGHGNAITFENLPAGDYTVLAERGGFTPDGLGVELSQERPNGEAVLSVGLDRLEGSGLDLRGVCATDEFLRGLVFDAEGNPTGGTLAGANLSGLRLVSPENLEACREAGVGGGELVAEGVDLSCLDLRGVDLSGTDLSGANLVGADLSGANLANTVMQQVALAEAMLAGTTFFGADLRRANFHAPGDTLCDPVEGERPPRFQGTDFAQADLSGALFTSAPEAYGPEDPFADFDCEAEAPEARVDLRAVDFSSATLNGAVLFGADLGAINLSSASMRGTDLRNAILEAFVEVPDAEPRLTGAAMVLSDLSGADLRCAAMRRASLLGAVIADADLTKAALAGATFTEAVVDGTILVRADLSETRFIGVLFAGAQLSGAVFHGADMRNAEFVDAIFHTGELLVRLDDEPAGEDEPLRPVRLNNANLADANLRGVNLEGAELRGAIVSSANLRESTLIRVDFTGTNAVGANLVDADLTDAILADVAFEGSNPGRRAFYSARTLWPAGVPIPKELTNPCPAVAPWPEETPSPFIVPAQAHLLYPCVNLSAERRDVEQQEEEEEFDIRARAATDLTRADLREMDLRGIDLSLAILRGADLRGLDLRGANLQAVELEDAILREPPVRLADASLLDVDFRGEDLSGFDLSGARLRRANLQGVNLSNANLSGAFLQAADLSNADLTETDLTGAQFDAETVWPDPFDSDDAIARGASDKPDSYVRVEAGSFLMYSPVRPTTVNITRPFLIQITETTQEQAEQVLGACPFPSTTTTGAELGMRANSARSPPCATSTRSPCRKV